MKHLKHLFTALLLLCSTAVAAKDFKVDGIYYNITSGQTVAVTSYPGTSSYSRYAGNVVIPESVTYNGATYSVTSIDAYAFNVCTELISIKIPNSVISIGDYAFEDCTGLTGITIPNSVTSVGSSVFSGCTGLMSIIVATGNTNYDSRDNCNAIIETATNTLVFGCKNTLIPNSVTSIRYRAFNNCTGLTSITIPNSVTSIGEVAFNGCTGLTRITIPNSVTSIGYEAFGGCTGLRSIEFNAEYCTTMGSGSNYPVFKGCTALSTITIGENVQLILDYAFYGCTGLTSITIPNSVTSIGEGAFYGCTGLTSVVIGNSVKSIGDKAFSGCTGLRSIEFNAEYCTTMNGDSNHPVFEGCTALSTITIGENVQLIPDYAFYGCTGLTSITIPNSVTSIGGDAFSDCTGLTSVNFNAENCTSMGSYYNSVFSDCTALSTVTIGENVKNIPDYAFSGCSGLTSIEIPNSVTSIGESAFSWCTGLTSITIPNSVTSIGYSAFENCSSLTSITIPNSVTSIEYKAFSGCTGLTSITIPNSVTSIGDYAFSDCTGLTSVTIPNSVTSIGGDAFSDCTGLTSVEIPNSVTSIGGSAFSCCSSLTSITIPNSVTSIENHAFSGCTGLTSVVIPNSVTSIGEYAFEDCVSLRSVAIPNSVTSIGEGAFKRCHLYVVVNLSNLPLEVSCNYLINSADISGISLNKSQVTVEKNDSFTLRAELQIPFDLHEDYEYFLSEASLFTWSASGDFVATVKDGVVTAVDAGTTRITATAGGYSATCVVSVGKFNGITSLEQLENDALYHISQPYHVRGATSWAVDEALKSNVDLDDEVSSNSSQWFAIISIDGGAKRYLYHPDKRKFINKDGSLGEKPVDAVNIKAGAFDNTFMFYFDNTHYINVGGSRQMIIDGWSIPDGGNSCLLEEVGNFDPTWVLGQWVTGISLDKSAATLVEGESLTLKATVLGSVGDMPVTWSTTDSSVATVKDGVVTAVAAGTATITAKAGSYSATCVVTVEKKVIAVTGIALSPTSLRLTEGETRTLVATVTPSDATDKTVTWNTSNSSVATVKDGVVTAVAAGTATITATAGDCSASCNVTVYESLSEQLKNNALYYISQPHHTQGATSWAIDKGGKALKSNVDLGVELSSSDTRQQFAILGIDGGAKRYLYHPGEKKFINKDGSLGEKPVDAVNIKAGAFDNTFMFYFDNTHYINVDRYRHMIIDGWSIPDGGNSCVLEEVGHFDPTEVLGQWVTGISLDKSAATLVEGESLTLKATVKSVSGSIRDMPVAWSTSNSSVVTVKDGLVTAVAAGTATITARFGDYSATCVVTVEKKVIAVTGISLSESKVTLTEGETMTLIATVAPSDATDKTVAWSTSNSSVATVKDGLVTAVAAGTATITATAGDYSATCDVTIEKKIIAVTGISLSESKVTLTEGETKTLVATVTPSDAADKTVAWSTSNSSVATVKDGVVTAVAAGTATITAKAGGYSATCVVTVEEKVITVTGITLSETKVTLTEGETMTLIATVTPSNAVNKTVTWSTSNSAAATVEDGVVTAVAPGRTRIIAKAGGYSATCVVFVKKFNGITSLEQLKNNALYYISQPHHTNGATSWAVDKGGEALKSNVDLGVELSSSDTRQQFAILSIDGGATRYLYHAGEKKFINKDGSLGEKPVDAVNIEAGAFKNTFMFYFDDVHYINVDSHRHMTIDYWSTPDGGNSCTIVPVAEFDPEVALGIITGIEDVEDVDGEIVVYNLQGNRVLDVDKLERGIYIVNGKKVFVK